MFPPWPVIKKLLRNDARLIARDSLLVVLLCMVVALGIICRQVLPVLDASLARNGILPNESSAMRFSETFPLWVAFIGLWQAALMPGTVFAFLLLDEKEEHTLSAMRVTPVPAAQYLAYRAAVPTVLAVLFACALVPLIGYAPVHPLQLLALALAGCLTAPIVTLLIATFAQDKVQGFAFNKFGGIAGLLIIFGWFVPLPWQWLMCLFPPFAVAKGYWMAAAGEPWWWAPTLFALLSQAGIVAVLLPRLSQRTAP